MPPPRKPHNPTQEAVEQAEKAILEKELPHAIDAEKYILGCIILRDEHFPTAATTLTGEEFMLESHKRVYARMRDLHERSERINHTTLAHELNKHRQLESIGGLTALVEFDRGLPDLPDIGSYIRLVKDAFSRRCIIFDAQRRIDQAMAGADPKDIAAAGLASLQEIQAGHSDTRKKGQTPEDIAATFPGGPGAFLDPSQRPKGLPTGILRLDAATLGLHPGELVILAARPSVGKSALMLNIAEHLCLNPKQRKAVSVFSLEMSNADNLTRILCSTSRVDSHKFRSGFLNSEERRRLQVGLYDLTQSRLKLYDSCVMMTDIESAIERDVDECACVLAAVDYIGLIGVKKKGERRDLDVADITRRFKLLAQRLSIPILLLCQLSRAGDKRTGSSIKPILSDLRESGAIEADADQVWFIDRPELRDRDREDIRGLADLIIGKNRHGSTSTIPLRFIGALTKFENRSEDLDEPSLESM